MGVSSSIQAQSFSAVSFNLRGDYEYSKLYMFDINDFYRNYNAYYAGVIPQPFDTLNPTVFSHPNLGASVRFASGDPVGFYTGLSMVYGRTSFDQQAKFQNNLITNTGFNVADWNLQIDAGLIFFRVLTLEGLVAARSRKTFMEIGYTYQDGSYSVGNEYDILGVYQASTTTLDWGLAAGLRLGRLYIPVSISFPTNMLSDDGLLTLTDFDETQVRWSDLPRDYQTWANDPVNMDLETGFVRAQSFQSMRINVGVEFAIFQRID